jgi:hypothetical protein
MDVCALSPKNGPLHALGPERVLSTSKYWVRHTRTDPRHMQFPRFSFPARPVPRNPQTLQAYLLPHYFSVYQM